MTLKLSKHKLLLLAIKTILVLLEDFAGLGYTVLRYSECHTQNSTKAVFKKSLHSAPSLQATVMKIFSKPAPSNFFQDLNQVRLAFDDYSTSEGCTWTLQFGITWELGNPAQHGQEAGFLPLSWTVVRHNYHRSTLDSSVSPSKLSYL